MLIVPEKDKEEGTTPEAKVRTRKFSKKVKAKYKSMDGLKVKLIETMTNKISVESNKRVLFRMTALRALN